jgi:hypothetical protein
MDKMQGGGVPFIAVHCRRAMQACAMEREGGDGSR